MSDSPTTSIPPAPTLDGMLRDAYVSHKLDRTHSSSDAMEQSWARVFGAKFDATVAESAKYGLTGTAFTAAERAAVPLRNAAALAWDAHTIAYGNSNSPKRLSGTYRQYLLREAANGNKVAETVVRVRGIS